MARPRTITDERLLNAVGVAISARGPGFTIADVAAVAGVSVGTVSQRFGSKHGLLKALFEAAIDQVRAQVRAAADVRAAIMDVYRELDDPATAANNLGQLAADLADPQLREAHGEFFAVFEQELAVHVRGVPGAPPHAARILVCLANGTAISWSVRPSGSLLDRIAEDIDAVLKGWQHNG
nr:TetR/AcrR family transcriptional regulator [Kibdelosporangium sp. MJ126-NF4]CEL15915.1 Transcriptional regulator, TetR family [Kibdelosporangium sp. MJ126-NF4]CTQ93839.1 Transcriptional regulator, TetR family [Kibdelosporangium sp. MJ126-NF4]